MRKTPIVFCHFFDIRSIKVVLVLERMSHTPDYFMAAILVLSVLWLSHIVSFFMVANRLKVCYCHPLAVGLDYDRLHAKTRRN